MIDRNTTKKPFETIVRVVTALALIAGGVLAALEYKDRKESNRVAQVLSFLERYNQEPIRSYRNNKIKAQVAAGRKNDPRSGRILASQSDGNSDLNCTEDRQAYEIDMVDSFGELRYEIDYITYFFDELYTCVEKEICDEAVTHSFFGKQAYDFLDELRCYVHFVKGARKRRGVEGYADGLLSFEEVYDESRAPPGEPQ